MSSVVLISKMKFENYSKICNSIFTLFFPLQNKQAKCKNAPTKQKEPKPKQKN